MRRGEETDLNQGKQGASSNADKGGNWFLCGYFKDSPQNYSER